MATCDWAIVCDYAFLDITRKVCLIGVFDRIFTPAVPSVHPQAALALRLVGNPNETVDLRADIIRPTGELLARIEGRGELGDAGTAEVHMGMAGLPLPDFGIYAFNVYLGDALAKTIAITVAPAPPSSLAPEGGRGEG